MISPSTDLDALADSELDAELVGLLRERHRLDAQIARRARRWDARSVWLSDGSRAPAARLSRDANMAKSTAEHVVRVGSGGRVDAGHRGSVGGR